MIGTLLAVVQAGAWVITPPAPTVGDTVRLERLVPAVGDVRVRAQPLGNSLLLEPLDDPVIDRTDRGARVRYTVALFEPGRHGLSMPPVELLHADGRVDLVSTDTAWVSVGSVLPPGDTLPPPRASLAPLPRFPTRVWPTAVLSAVVLAGAGAWAVARRRTRAAAVPPSRPRGVAAPPLPRWISAGEARAVAAVAADRLRARIAELVPEADRSLGTEESVAVLEQKRPDWPMRELADVLRGLERARFAPAVQSDVITLVNQVDELVRDL